mgnify:CR=1 FL=1
MVWCQSGIYSSTQVTMSATSLTLILATIITANVVAGQPSQEVRRYFTELSLYRIIAYLQVEGRSLLYKPGFLIPASANNLGLNQDIYVSKKDLCLPSRFFQI